MLRSPIAVLLATLLLVAACNGTSDPAAPDQLEGVVVGVEATSPLDVRSFELRSEGRTYEILIDAERDYGFRLSHLQEHVVSADPVAVEVEERNGKLYAVSIEDA